MCDYMDKTPELKEFTKGWESRVRFELSGEAPFDVVFEKDLTVNFEQPPKSGSTPDVTFYCDSETFFGLMTGRLDQDEAFSNGLVEVKGSILDSVKFRHAAEITQKRHGTLFTVLRAVSRFT